MPSALYTSSIVPAIYMLFRMPAVRPQTHMSDASQVTIVRLPETWAAHSYAGLVSTFLGALITTEVWQSHVDEASHSVKHIMQAILRLPPTLILQHY